MPGAGKNGQAVLKHFRLAEEWTAADALADVDDHRVLLLAFGLAELDIGFVQSFTEAMAFEAAHRHAAVIDLAENSHCFIESAQLSQLHQLGELVEGAVPVGLADNASAIDVDEQCCDFVSACTQVAVGRLTFAHIYLFSFQV